MQLFSFVGSRPTIFVDPEGLSKRFPMPKYPHREFYPHHLFPQKFREKIESLCDGFFIDLYLVPAFGGNSAMDKWSEHWWWHHGCKDEHGNNLENMVDNILKETDNCCEFMIRMMELTASLADCVGAAWGHKLPPGLPTPSNMDPYGLIKQFCGCDYEHFDPKVEPRLIPFVPAIPDLLPRDLPLPFPPAMDNPEVDFPPFHGTPLFWPRSYPRVSIPFHKFVPAIEILPGLVPRMGPFIMPRIEMPGQNPNDFLR